MKDGTFATMYKKADAAHLYGEFENLIERLTQRLGFLTRLPSSQDYQAKTQVFLNVSKAIRSILNFANQCTSRSLFCA